MPDPEFSDVSKDARSIPRAATLLLVLTVFVGLVGAAPALADAVSRSAMASVVSVHVSPPAGTLSCQDARYYDPNTGRFTSRDPVWDRANSGSRYSFVANSPLNGSDPFGKRDLRESDKLTLSALERLAAATEGEGRGDDAANIRAIAVDLKGDITLVPDGKRDPNDLQVRLAALKLWRDDSDKFRKAKETKVGPYTEWPAGAWKCNSFIAATLWDAYSIIVDQSGFWGTNPPIANVWGDPEAKIAKDGGPYGATFPVRKQDPMPGDILAFPAPEGYAGHVGIYLGHGMYVSATVDYQNHRPGLDVQPPDGLVIKSLPTDENHRTRVARSVVVQVGGQ